MRCLNCQSEVTESAAFCNHCGAQLQNICNNCKNFNPFGSNFCSHCGLSLSPAAYEVENPTISQEAHRVSPVSSAICPRCHKVNESGSAYCYSCGLPLDELSDSSPQPQPYSQTLEEAARQRPHAERSAGFWIRLVAIFIDSIILIIMSLVLVGALPGVSISDYLENLSFSLDEEETTPLWFDVIDIALNTMYSAVLVSVWATTIGKRIFGLYVVRADGSKVGFGRALARWISYFASALILGIGFLMIAFRKDKRGLHDLICDTKVVRR